MGQKTVKWSTEEVYYLNKCRFVLYPADSRQQAGGCDARVALMIASPFSFSPGPIYHPVILLLGSRCWLQPASELQTNLRKDQSFKITERALLLCSTSNTTSRHYANLRTLISCLFSLWVNAHLLHILSWKILKCESACRHLNHERFQ